VDGILLVQVGSSARHFLVNTAANIWVLNEVRTWSQVVSKSLEGGLFQHYSGDTEEIHDNNERWYTSLNLN